MQLDFSPPRVAFVATNNAHSYSGGRYHALIQAYALARAGASVTFITNKLPIFLSDLDPLAPGEVEFHLTGSDLESEFDEPLDWVFVVPTGIFNPAFYENALRIAERSRARIALTNFESANWFNAVSPSPRDPRLWDYWRRVCFDGALVLSSTHVSDRYARAFYRSYRAPLRFEVCPPPINSPVAMNATGQECDGSIIAFVRDADIHKGGADLLALDPTTLVGRTLRIVSGGGISPTFEMALRSRFDKSSGVTLEFHNAVSDETKFQLLGCAKALLFPSRFEGFGYPPVEAAYVGAEIACYDLEVLRETVGSCANLAPVGDVAALNARLTDALQTASRPAELRSKVARIAEVDSVGARLREILDRSAEKVHRRIPANWKVSWGPWTPTECADKIDETRRRLRAISPALVQACDSGGKRVLLQFDVLSSSVLAGAKIDDPILAFSDVETRIVALDDGLSRWRVTALASREILGRRTAVQFLDSEGNTLLEEQLQLQEIAEASPFSCAVVSCDGSQASGWSLRISVAAEQSVDEIAVSADGEDWRRAAVVDEEAYVELPPVDLAAQGATLFAFANGVAVGAAGGFPLDPTLSRGGGAPLGIQSEGVGFRPADVTNDMWNKGVGRSLSTSPLLGEILVEKASIPHGAEVGDVVRFGDGRRREIARILDDQHYVRIGFKQWLSPDLDGHPVEHALFERALFDQSHSPQKVANAGWRNGVWRGQGALAGRAIRASNEFVAGLERGSEISIGGKPNKVEGVFWGNDEAVIWLKESLTRGFPNLSIGSAARPAVDATALKRGARQLAKVIASTAKRHIVRAAPALDFNRLERVAERLLDPNQTKSRNDDGVGSTSGASQITAQRRVSIDETAENGNDDSLLSSVADWPASPPETPFRTTPRIDLRSNSSTNLLSIGHDVVVGGRLLRTIRRINRRADRTSIELDEAVPADMAKEASLRPLGPAETARRLLHPPGAPLSEKDLLSQHVSASWMPDLTNNPIRDIESPERPRVLVASLVPMFPADQGNRIVTRNLVAHAVAQGFDVDLLGCGHSDPLAIERAFGDRVRVFEVPFPDWRQADASRHREKLLRDLKTFEFPEYEAFVEKALNTVIGWHHPYFIIPDELVQLGKRLYAKTRYQSIICNYTHMVRLIDELRTVRELPSVAVITHDALSRLPAEFGEHRFDHMYRACPSAVERDALNAIPGATICAISMSELSYFKQLGVTNPVILTEYDGFEECRRYATSDLSFESKTIVFHASGNPMNVASLNWFLENCWGRVRNVVPDAKLIVCGRVGKSIWRPPLGVEVIGEVSREQLMATLHRATVAINPTIAGTGLKIKSVEAACLGLPSVCLPAAVEGLEDVADQFAVVAKTPREFANACTSLLLSHERWSELRQTSLALAEQRFSEAKVYESLDRTLGWSKDVEKRQRVFRRPYSSQVDDSASAVLDADDELQSAARSLLDSGFEAAALPILELCARTHSKETYSCLLLASRIHKKLGNLASAIGAAAQAVASDPRNPRAYIALAEAYRAAGKSDDAELALRKGRLASPLMAMPRSSGLPILPGEETPTPLTIEQGARFEPSSEYDRLHDHGFGWSAPESWGTWSVGGYSSILLKVQSGSADGLRKALKFKAGVHAATPKNVASKRLVVSAGGAHLGSFDLAIDGGLQIIEGKCRPSMHDGVVRLDFRTANSAPAANDDGAIVDQRELGFALHWFELVD